MEDTIRIKTIFSNGIDNGGPHNQALRNPFIVLKTPFLPTLISISVTFIISGLKNNEDYFASAKVIRCDSNEPIFESKKYPIKSVNEFNTVVNLTLENAKVDQKESGDYKATITIFDNDQNEVKKDGDTFKLLKIEE